VVIGKNRVVTALGFFADGHCGAPIDRRGLQGSRDIDPLAQ
jgi:hypothetical protein